MLTKKIFSGLLCIILIMSCSITGFAEKIYSPSSENTVVTYGVDAGFTVIIPSEFAIDADGEASAIISATDVFIDHGSVLEVYISGHDYIDSWELIDVEESSNRLEYIIGTSAGADDIVNNSVVLSVNAGEAFDSTKSETIYLKVVDTLKKAGTYTDTLTFTVNWLEYKFIHYYGTLKDATTDINDGNLGNTAVDKESANYGVYFDENDVATIVLLNDTTEAKSSKVSKDINLNLNGHKITMNGTSMLINVAQYSNITVTVNGRKAGSEVDMTSLSGAIRMFQVTSGSTVNIFGGTYSVHANKEASVLFMQADTELNMSGSYLRALSDSGFARGVGAAERAKLFVSNSTIIAESIFDDTTDSYGTIGIIFNDDAEAIINNCTIRGMHSAILAHGNISINGGVYEGYSHGGLYLSSAPGSYYIKDAEFNEWHYDEEYDVVSESNHAGIYIGGTGTNDVSLYVDNCSFNGGSYPIVLRGTDGETNISLYISNSEINLDSTKGIRIDNDTHKLYLGYGNNFDASNTTRPGAVVVTNETYR